MSSNYDELIGKLPEIAKVVNEFDSPEAQQRAFDLLAASLGIAADPQPNEGESIKARAKKNAKPKETKPRSPSTGPKMLGDLVLNPSGKQSFKDFAKEKNPTSNFERSVVAVYYLEQVLEVNGITADHVFTAYKSVGWRPPSDPRNNLQVVKSKHAWIETQNMDAIATTYRGRTFVEHDLPKKKTED